MDVRLKTWITGDGPPLIIQAPAWGPSSDYLRLTLAPLLDGFRVITYDPRNVGGSQRLEAPDAQAVEHLADDLESLRDELGLDRFVLAGHSHGGFIAMAYAVRHQRHLDGLVLLNTAVRRDVRIRDDDLERVLDLLAEDPARREAVEIFRATSGRLRGVETDAELARRMRQLMPAYFYDLEAMKRFSKQARGARPPSAQALARVGEELDPWVEEGLPEVTAPALVITGRYDVATTPANARHIQSLLPRSRLEIFERSGHHPWVEEPQHFERTVRGFLRDIGFAPD